MKRLQKTFMMILVLMVLITQMGRSSTITDNQNTSNELIIYTENEELEPAAFLGYNVFVRTGLSDSVLTRKIIIANLNDEIIFEKSAINISAQADIDLYNSTTVIIGDDESTTFWNFETDVMKKLDFGGHHETEVNYLNNTFFTLEDYEIEINNISYTYDLINERNSSGHVLRSIDTRDFVEPWQLCPYEDMIGTTVDVTHANSFLFDEDEKAIYLNCRNTNTFYKIDYITGELIWGIGEYGNFTLFDIYGNQNENLFYHCHALDKIDENTFILFDNDFHNQTDALNRQSRYVEITIDEEKMYANTTWQWIGPTDYWSSMWGDCNYLANQNKLGIFLRKAYHGTPVGSKVVEVDNEGNIVGEFMLPPDEETIYTSYRIERFRFSPIVSQPIITEEKEKISFEWQIWYNFKSKTNFTGKYYLYLDNQKISTGNILFPKYWAPKQLNYSLDVLELGQHTISLIVEDEGGHLSNESAFYPGVCVFEIGEITSVNLNIDRGIILPLIITFMLLKKQKVLNYKNKIRFL
ncbi:MAG: aryl-sulfate sulfotransferase [Candidatus Heimdallarchaeaceae archaeon]